MAGTLLLGTGLLAEGILRTFTKRSHRLAWLRVPGLVLLLVWAELAGGCSNAIRGKLEHDPTCPPC